MPEFHIYIYIGIDKFSPGNHGEVVADLLIAAEHLPLRVSCSRASCRSTTIKPGCCLCRQSSGFIDSAWLRLWVVWCLRGPVHRLYWHKLHAALDLLIRYRHRYVYT
uniref:Uncharacterized protein n=1 Tax=Picea glauca TaxID=3330 RepID=A0A101M324_PICGL|nr:hypothetical protein ABT39_MTgene3378 [Picea glauca]